MICSRTGSRRPYSVRIRNWTQRGLWSTSYGQMYFLTSKLILKSSLHRTAPNLTFTLTSACGPRSMTVSFLAMRSTAKHAASGLGSRLVTESASDCQSDRLTHAGHRLAGLEGGPANQNAIRTIPAPLPGSRSTPSVVSASLSTRPGQRGNPSIINALGNRNPCQTPRLMASPVFYPVIMVLWVSPHSTISRSYHWADNVQRSKLVLLQSWPLLLPWSNPISRKLVCDHRWDTRWRLSLPLCFKVNQ
jgi:hypothetical protein